MLVLRVGDSTPSHSIHLLEFAAGIMASSRLTVADTYLASLCIHRSAASPWRAVCSGPAGRGLLGAVGDLLLKIEVSEMSVSLIPGAPSFVLHDTKSIVQQHDRAGCVCLALVSTSAQYSR